jgi:hypothetical protein
MTSNKCVCYGLLGVYVFLKKMDIHTLMSTFKLRDVMAYDDTMLKVTTQRYR